MANDEPSDAPPASPPPPRGHEFWKDFGKASSRRPGEPTTDGPPTLGFVPTWFGGGAVARLMAATQGLNSTMVMTAQQQQAATAMQQLQHHCHMSFHTSPHTLRGEGHCGLAGRYSN